MAVSPSANPPFSTVPLRLNVGKPFQFGFDWGPARLCGGLHRNIGGDVKGDDSGSEDGRHTGWREVRLARHLGGLSHRGAHRLLRYFLHDNYLWRLMNMTRLMRDADF